MSSTGNERKSSIETTLRNLKDGLNGTLFAMAKTPKVVSSNGNFLKILATLIDALQIAAFILPKKSSIDMGYGTERVETLSWTLIGGHITDLIGVELAVILSLVIVILELLNLVYVGYSWATGQYQVLWPIHLLRHTMSFLSGILFIPIVSILSHVFVCKGIENEQMCVILTPITVLTLIAFVGISFLVAVSLFDSSVMSNSVNARAHSRLKTLQLCSKTLFAIAYTILSASTVTTPRTRLFWSVWCLAWTALVAGLTTWYQPHFRRMSTMFHATINNILMMLAMASFIVVNLYDDSYNTESVLMYFVICGFVFSFPFTYIMVDYRRFVLACKDVKKCGNVFEFELKCRIHFQGVGEHYVADASKVDRSVLEQRIALINEWYRIAEKRFQDSSMLHIFYANFLLEVDSQRKALIRRSICLAEKYGVTIDNSFHLFRLSRKVDELSQDGGQDVLQYVKYKKYSTEAVQAEKTCLKLLLMFWDELSSKHPNVNRLRDIALNVVETSERALKTFQDLIRIAPHSLKAHSMFSEFLHEVSSNQTLANKIDGDISRLMKAKAQGNSAQNLDDVNADDIGVLVVSAGFNGAGRFPGEIMAVNEYASTVLNQTTHSLVGADFLQLLQGPLADNFVHIVKEFIELGQDRFFDERFKTFIRIPSSGESIMTNAKLKAFSSPEFGFCIYFLFKKSVDPLDVAGEFILLSKQDYLIEGMGSRVQRMFTHVRDMTGLTLETHQELQHVHQGHHGTKQVSISKFFPSFGEFMQIPSSMKRPMEAYVETTIEPRSLVIKPQGIPKQKELMGDANGAEGNSKTQDPGYTKTAVNLWVQEVEILGESVLQLFLQRTDYDYRSREGHRNLQAPNPLDELDDDFYDGNTADPDVNSMNLNLSDTETDCADDSFVAPGTSSRAVTFAGKPRRTVTSPKRHPGSSGRSVSSNGSSTAIRNRAHAIRSALARNSQDKMDPTIARLLKAYAIMDFLFILIAVATYLIVYDVLETYRDSIVFLNDLGFRRFCTVSFGFIANTLTLINRGVMPASEAQVTSLLNEIGTLSDKLKTADYKLFERRMEVGGALQQLYEEKATVFARLESGQLILDQVNLYEGVTYLTTLAKQASTLSLQDFTPTNSLTFPLFANIDGFQGTVLDGLEDTTREFASFTRAELESQRSMLMIETMICIAITCLVVSVTSYLVVGNGGKIEMIKMEILEVFNQIPKRVTRELLVRYSNRLEVAHDESVIVPSGGLVSPSNGRTSPAPPPPNLTRGNNGKKVVPLAPPLLTNGAKVAPDSQDQTGSITSMPSGQGGVKIDDSIATMTTKSTEKKNKRKKRNQGGEKRRCYNSKKLCIMIKLALLIVLPVCYFVTTAIILNNTVQDVGSLPMESNYAGKRRMVSRKVSHKILMWLSQPFANFGYGDQIRLNQDAQDVRDASVEFQHIHRSLLHGNATEGLTGIFNQEEYPALMDTVNVYINDGCAGWPKTTPSREDCLSFDNGLLSQGLDATLQTYGIRVLDLLQNSNLATLLENGNGNMEEVFAFPDLQYLLALEGLYLQPQLTTVIKKMAVMAWVPLQSAESNLLILTVCFSIAMVIAHVQVIRKLFRNLDDEAKRSRSLLIVIPEDVLDELHDLQAFLVNQFSGASTLKTDTNTLDVTM